MSNHKDALNFIKKLLEKYSAGGYVFRGANEEFSLQENNGVHDGINSTLYRKIMEEDEGKELKEALAKNGMPFFPAFIEKSMVDETRRYFPSNASNLEILTDLQHFGGATNMIDFSRSIYVALFFACQGSTDADGEFIALSLNEADKIDAVDYTARPKAKALEIIVPARLQNSNYRVNFQGSVFVRPAEGYIPCGKCKVEPVQKELKKHLLQCLKNTCGITSSNIYNDFHGVITTQKDFLKRNTFSYLAKAYYFSDNLKESLSSSDQSISLNPDESYTDYNERGIIYVSSHQYQRAIEDFNKAISLNSEFADAYNNRGNAYGNLMQYQRAIQDFDRAISLNPEFAEAYSNRGNAYNGLRQYQRAIQDFDKTISLKPNLAAAYSNRGNAYNSLDQHQRAIQDFDKAILLKPNLAAAYSNRGNAYSCLEQYQRAIEDLNKAISINHEFADAYNNRGNAYEGLGQYQRAIQDYDKAISLNPKFFNAYNNRGSAYNSLGKHERAIEDFDKAVLLNPDLYLTYFNRGLVYSRLDQHERAIEDFDKSIKINPNYAPAYYCRGLVKRKIGDEEGAKADFAKAQKLGIVLPEGLLPSKK